MSHEQMISHTKNNYLNSKHHQNEDDHFLQMTANSKIKRVNRSDPIQWEWSWGPPV